MTELETLVIRMVLEAQQSLNEAKQVTRGFKDMGEGASEGAGEAGQAVRGLGVGLRDTRHAMHLLAMTRVIPHEAIGPIIGAVHALHLLHKASHAAAAGMFTLRAAMMMTGIGLAVAAVGYLITYLMEARKEEEALAEAAAKAAGTVVGAADAQEAAARELAAQIKKTAEELEKAKDPGFWKLMKEIATSTETDMGKVVAKVKEEQAQEVLLKEAVARTAAVRAAEDPAVKRREETRATLEARAAIEAKLRKQELEALLIDKSKMEREAYVEVEKLAIVEMSQGLSAAEAWARAEELIGEAAEKNLDIMREQKLHKDKDRAEAEFAKKEGAAVEGIENQIEALETSAATKLMDADATKRYTIELAMEKAQMDLSTRAIIDAQLAAAEAKNANADLNKEIHDLGIKAQEATIRMTESADAAEWFAMKQKILKEHAGLTAEQLAKLKAAFDETKNVEFIGKMFDKTMTKFEKYEKDVQQINKAFDFGRKYPELYARAIEDAAKELEGAAAAGEKFQATGFFSAEALTRMEEFTDRVTPSLFALRGGETGAGLRVEAVGAVGPEGAGRMTDLLQLQVDILKDIRGTSPLLPANLRGGGGYRGVPSGGID
jgi:hypothetical protein